MSEGKELNCEDYNHLIQELYYKQDTNLREQHNRSLPFQDALFDRWERAKILGFGKGTSIYNSAVIFGDVSVEEETWIGPHVILDGSGGAIKIGNTCSIASGVQIYTHDTIAWALSGGVLEPHCGKVEIGDSTYIGPQSIISASVKIGSRCVIAANSFVKSNVPDNKIMGGTPAKILGEVKFEEGRPVLVYKSGKLNKI